MTKIYNLEHEKLIETVISGVNSEDLDLDPEMVRNAVIEVLVQEGEIPEDASTEDHIGEADHVPEVGEAVEIDMGSITPQDIEDVIMGMARALKEDKAEGARSLEELDAEMSGRNIVDFDPIGEQAVPEEWEIPESQDLDFDEIAEIAYNTVSMYKNLMFPKLPTTPLYEGLSSDDREHLKLEVQEVMNTAHDPNDQNIARVKYAQVAMRNLSEGLKYGAEPGEGLSPEVVPWEYLPNNYKMPYFLFRDVAVRLVRSVWSGI